MGLKINDVLEIPVVFQCVVTLVKIGALLRTLPAFLPSWFTMGHFCRDTISKCLVYKPFIAF